MHILGTIFFSLVPSQADNSGNIWGVQVKDTATDTGAAHLMAETVLTFKSRQF